MRRCGSQPFSTFHWPAEGSSPLFGVVFVEVLVDYFIRVPASESLFFFLFLLVEQMRARRPLSLLPVLPSGAAVCEWPSQYLPHRRSGACLGSLCARVRQAVPALPSLPGELLALRAGDGACGRCFGLGGAGLLWFGKHRRWVFV